MPPTRSGRRSKGRCEEGGGPLKEGHKVWIQCIEVAFQKPLRRICNRAIKMINCKRRVTIWLDPVVGTGTDAIESINLFIMGLFSE